MAQLSQSLTTAINQAALTLVEHVAKKDKLALADDSSVRRWTKSFGHAVAKYRGVVRIITAETEKPYTDSDDVKHSLRAADNFLLKHVHWTWDERWLDERWKSAAQERKKIWEEEEERRRKQKEEEERLRKKREEEKDRAILAKVQAFLNAEVLISDYPTEEEWAVLRDEPLADEHGPSPINLFDPIFDPIDDMSSPLSDLSTCVDSRSPPPTAPTPLQSPRLLPGKILDDLVPLSLTSADISLLAHAKSDHHPKLPGRRGSGPANTAARPTTAKLTTISLPSPPSDASPTNPTNPNSIANPIPIEIDIDLPTTNSTNPTNPAQPKTRTSKPTLPAHPQAVNAKMSPTTGPIHPIGPTQTQTAQIGIGKTQIPPATQPTPSSQPAQPTPPTQTLPLAQTQIQQHPRGVRRPRDVDADADEDDDEDADESEDDESLYLRLEGGTLIGTGQVYSPSCSSCSACNSKCFRLNAMASCARCYQEHIKCPLDKEKDKHDKQAKRDKQEKRELRDKQEKQDKVDQREKHDTREQRDKHDRLDKQDKQDKSRPRAKKQKTSHGVAVEVGN